MMINFYLNNHKWTLKNSLSNIVNTVITYFQDKILLENCKNNHFKILIIFRF